MDFIPKKNHDIFYLDYRIFPAGVDQSKVGKVFPCLVLKVVHSRIGDHLEVFFMMMMVRMMMMVMMIKPNDKEMMRMIKKRSRE